MKLSPQSVGKIRSYVGFAIRAGKVIYGADNVLEVKKPSLVLYSSDLSANTLKKLTTHAERYKCVLQMFEDWQELTVPEGCKAFAIRDRHLSDAITEQINKNGN